MRLDLFTYQGPSFLGGGKIAASFKNIQTIVNGPKGDGYVTDMIVMRERIKYFSPVICSNMRNHEMFKGTLPRLFEIIHKVLNEFPDDIVLIFETCSSSLLKEDLKSALIKFNEEERRRIFFFENDYFKECEDVSASSTLLHLIQSFSKENQMKRENSVNIIGTSLLNFNYSHDLKGIKTILDDLKVKINLTLPFECPVNDLKNICKASLNICADVVIAAKSLKFLKKKYEQDFLLPPFGFSGSKEFVNHLANQFNADFSKYVEEKENEITTKYESLLKDDSLKNKKVFVFGDMTSVLGVSSIFCNDLNFSNVCAGFYNVRFKKIFSEINHNSNVNYFITQDSLEVENKLMEFKPDLIMGTLNEERYASQNKIPFIRISSPMRHVETMMFPFRSFMGYKGMNTFLLELKQFFS